MAKFEIAEKITGRNEGGYANDPDDRGGETYAGISRVNWPNWGGWLLIDRIKKEFGKSTSMINKRAAVDQGLQKQISNFYRINFWNVNKLDLIADQQLANSVYDFGVNSGTARAAKYLQDVAGTTQDGIVGNATLTAINKMDPEKALTAYNRKREDYYRSIAVGSQAKFLKSWLSRLKQFVC